MNRQSVSRFSPAALLTCCLVAAALTAEAPLLLAQEQALPERPRGSVFGYDPGEERRYVLGPPESLAGGEGAEWWLRFEGLDELDGEEVADFAFGHERFELMPGTWNPAEEILHVIVDGTLRVNMDGFPLLVQFEQRFVHQGEQTSSDSRRRATYTLEDGRYTKLLEVGTRDWDFKFGVPEFANVDLDVPRGLFLWMPSELACLGSSRATCVEHDPAFANPGFLSLAMPVLFEEIETEGKDERELAFFMPTTLANSPFRPVTTGRWLSRERDNFDNRERYFTRWKLKIGASEEVEVGPRTMHAWEIDMGGGIDRIYAEPSGRIVRVNLGSSMDNTRDRYIRLVFPSEEFTSPNEDPARDCCSP